MKKTAGQIEILLLVLVVLFFAFSFGGKKNANLSSGSSIIIEPSPSISQTECCDSGSGEDCQSIENKYFIWNGDRYELLKSGAVFADATHLGIPDPPTDIVNAPHDFSLDGKRVFINISENVDINVNKAEHPDCLPPGDLVGGCNRIADNLLIYVCQPEGPTDCIGLEGIGKMDTYIRSSRGEEIPEFIKECSQEVVSGPIRINPHEGSVVDRLVCPTSAPAGSNALQINYCKFEPRTQGSIPWVSPWCKPAIYLYPEEKKLISVKIFPKGNLTFTDPVYSPSGWDVLADPGGNIFFENKQYDYLYYEAEIPDGLIEKPSSGFTIKYENLRELFSVILPELGLNEKETTQFSEYWLKALPASKYYFVGIISEKNLNQIAPVSIKPAPSNFIRVTLYFEAIDGPLSINSPEIVTPVRDGFTALEWGGIVKLNPNKPFSCLM